MKRASDGNLTWYGRKWTIDFVFGFGLSLFVGEAGLMAMIGPFVFIRD
jgi:hypothetical protein